MLQGVRGGDQLREERGKKRKEKREQHGLSEENAHPMSSKQSNQQPQVRGVDTSFHQREGGFNRTIVPTFSDANDHLLTVPSCGSLRQRYSPGLDKSHRECKRARSY